MTDDHAEPDDAIDLRATAERVVAEAQPGEALEVVVGTSSNTSVRAYDGDVEAMTVARTAGVGIRIIRDGRQGFASAGSLEADVIAETLAEARSNVPFAEVDEFVRLAEPDGVAAVDQDLWDDSVLTTPTEDKVAMAIELEARVRSGDPRITGVRSASYGDRSSHSVIASTTGIMAEGRSTAASISALALAKDGDETQTGGGSDVGRGPASLDLAVAAEDAVARATDLLGATQPQSRRLTLVLEPRMAASLWSIIAGMMAGDRVLKGRTPFADRVGEAIAAAGVTITDDPTDPDSYGATPHDGEGLAARANHLVTAGVLQGFLYNTVAGAKAGVPSTASAVRGIRSTPGVGWQALRVEPGAQAPDDLVAGIDDGLFLHSMSGLHSGVNAVSGDFSVGAEGIMIRDGQLAEPVREATIASTLPKLLQDIVGLGDDLEHRPGGVSCSTLVIGDVSLGGS